MSGNIQLTYSIVKVNSHVCESVAPVCLFLKINDITQNSQLILQVSYTGVAHTDMTDSITLTVDIEGNDWRWHGSTSEQPELI